MSDDIKALVRGYGEASESYGNKADYPGSDAKARRDAAFADLLAAIERRGAGQEWTLTDLRRANALRQAEWCPDQAPDLSFRGNELAGEVGEACNVIKKLERERQGWAGSRATAAQLAEELADVVICADLVALAAGVDLYGAVQAKFDATSIRIGLSTRLSPSPKAEG